MKKRQLVRYNILLALFAISFGLASCKEVPEFNITNIPVYYDENDSSYLKEHKEPNPYYDTTKTLDSTHILRYKTGELKDSSFWKNNILNNERFLFYKNGNLMEYRFYNCQGALMYSREYDDNGKVLNEVGDPYIQVLTDINVYVGNSVLSKIYVATPPNCIHFLYGIDKEGRYKLNGEYIEPYIYTRYWKFEREGDYVFPFEIEFIDTLSNKKAISKDEINYIVRKKR